MFVRSCWSPRSEEDAYDLIEANPWALLLSNDKQGPLATNLPLLLDRSRGRHGVLVGHVARANRHSQVLLHASTPALAVFHGPAGYVTPSWYPGRDMPGTYYYTAVHCYGRVRAHTDGELEAALEGLNDRMERSIPGGWHMDEVPHSEITRRLPAILGFDLEIERLEGKFKLGQDEPKKDALAVAARFAASEDPRRRELGEAVRLANQDRPEGES